MRDKLVFLLLLGGTLCAAPHDVERRLQHMSLYLDEIGYQINHHKVEIDLFHERLKTAEDSLREGLRDLATLRGIKGNGPKLTQLEEGQKAVISDLKNLKHEIERCVSKQASLEKSVHAQIKEVQANLQKALVLLGGEEQNSYIVQAGDSLGLIAQKHKISLKSLKEANHLTSDNIYVGQKLTLP